MQENHLPDGFGHLQPFVAKWAHSSTNARYDMRLGSAYCELEAFHGAVKNDLERIKIYLDSIALADFDDADRRLARLVFAWVPVAEAVEVFKQPRVPDSKMYWDVQEEPEL